jgi:hypothetical protein
MTESNWRTRQESFGPSRSHEYDMLSQARLTELNLAGVAISAAIDPDGTLRKVGGEYEKVIAARFDQALPRIHTVVFSEEQRPDIKRKYPELLEPDPHAEFQVLFFDRLEDAVQGLIDDARERWRLIDCSLPPHNPDFVARKQLAARLRGFVKENQSGYLVIVGASARGKRRS